MRKSMPGWVKDLWKEIITPPGFIAIPKPQKSKTGVNFSSDSSSFKAQERKRRPVQKQHVNLSSSSEEEEEQSLRNIHLILRTKSYNPKVLEQYPFLVHRAIPFGPVIRLNTSIGPVALKRTNISKKRLLFIAEALNHVKKKGFSRFSQIIPNIYDSPAVSLTNQVYYTTRWVDGQSADFTSMLHVAQAASTFAEFHQASRDFRAAGYSPPSAYDIEKTVRSRVKDFDLFLTKAKSKRKPDGVDRFVIQNLPAYRKQAQQALRILEDSRCRDFLNLEKNHSGLCHLDITPQNLVVTQNNIVQLIDFDMMSYGPRMLDIGHLIRRSLQANDWIREPALISLVQINNIAPLLHSEYQLLQSILTFPHSIWRTCRNHYLQRATPYTLARLEKLQEQEDARQYFLEDFADHVNRHKGS